MEAPVPAQEPKGPCVPVHGQRKQLVKPPPTSLLPEAMGETMDLRPSDSAFGSIPNTGVKRYGEPQLRGPNPMTLPAEIGSRRRMSHSVDLADASPQVTSREIASPRVPETGFSTSVESGQPAEIWPGAGTPGRRLRHSTGSDFSRPAGVSSVPSPRRTVGTRYSLFSPRGTPRESLEDIRNEARRRQLSSDAAHRRSVGLWTAMDSSLSDSEAYDRTHALTQNTPRQQRRSLQQRSQGVAGGMQLKAAADAAVEEESNPSDMGTSRRPSQRRQLSPRDGDGGGSLSTGLTRVPTDECLKVALGTVQKGRKNSGAQDYIEGGPGPWDPLPSDRPPLADAWGRFSPRLRDPPKEIKGTAADDAAVPWATEKNMLPPPEVKRFVSARLPYGSSSDVPAPSLPPPEGTGIPLGLTMPPPSALMRGEYDGGSGGSGGPTPALLVEAAACSGATPAGQEALAQEPEALKEALREQLNQEMAMAVEAANANRSITAGQGGPRKVPQLAGGFANKAGCLTLASGSRSRGVSFDTERPRRHSIMSSSFVERQRETSVERGGRRLSLRSSSPSCRRESLFPKVRAPGSSPLRGGLRSGKSLGGDSSLSLPSDAVLDEVCNRRLEALNQEIKRVQNASTRIELSIRQTQEECGVLKSRNTTPAVTPAMSMSPAAMSPLAHTPGAVSPRVPMTPPVAATPPYGPPGTSPRT